MKLIHLTILTLCLTAVASFGQDPTSDLLKAVNDFKDGPITNVALIAGGNYNTSTKGWGGEALLGYNLPKGDTMPFHPWIMPMVGLTYLGNSWEGFSGTVALNAQIHPLSVFDGGSTNSAFHKFTVTLNGLGGVGENLSGEQFGPLHIPGHAAPNGQGTAAVTGEGASIGLLQTRSLKLGMWFERFDWTTVSGDILAAGIELKWYPPGWR